MECHCIDCVTLWDKKAKHTTVYMKRTKQLLTIYFIPRDQGHVVHLICMLTVMESLASAFNKTVRNS